jgi:hypothetical protein
MGLGRLSVGDGSRSRKAALQPLKKSSTTAIERNNSKASEDVEDSPGKVKASRTYTHSSQRHFQPRLGRATVFASFFDHTQAPTRCAPIEGFFTFAHLEFSYFSY